MTLQQPQQPGVVLGTDRPIMPVVSVGGVGVGVGVATTSQMNPVPQTPMTTVQQLPLPVCIIAILHCSIFFIYIRFISSRYRIYPNFTPIFKILLFLFRHSEIHVRTF